jgi:hypothetical protein
LKIFFFLFGQLLRAKMPAAPGFSGLRYRSSHGKAALNAC